jgi:hypothetical protein
VGSQELNKVILEGQLRMEFRPVISRAPEGQKKVDLFKVARPLSLQTDVGNQCGPGAEQFGADGDGHCPVGDLALPPTAKPRLLTLTFATFRTPCTMATSITAVQISD